MKTFKYYRINKTEIIPQLDNVEVFDYTTDGKDKIIGVYAADHTEFEKLCKCVKQTFASVKPLIINSHLAKEIDKLQEKRTQKRNELHKEIAQLKRKITRLNERAVAMDKNSTIIKTLLDDTTLPTKLEYKALVKAVLDRKRKRYGIKK